VLLPAVHESPIRRRSDTDISQLLRFRNRSILAGDMNAKYLFGNSRVPNASRGKLLQMFQIISNSQRHIVVHQNIRLSHVSASDLLNSDRLPIVFHILDLVTDINSRNRLKNPQIWKGSGAFFLT
jgi:hypothetical protein